LSQGTDDADVLGASGGHPLTVDVVLADLEEASLKEVTVVDKLVGQVELGLEIFPDKMILAVIKT